MNKYNSEHYRDTTAYQAMENAAKEKKQEFRFAVTPATDRLFTFAVRSKTTLKTISSKQEHTVNSL